MLERLFNPPRQPCCTQSMLPNTCCLQHICPEYQPKRCGRVCLEIEHMLTCVASSSCVAASRPETCVLGPLGVSTKEGDKARSGSVQTVTLPMANAPTTIKIFSVTACHTPITLPEVQATCTAALLCCWEATDSQLLPDTSGNAAPCLRSVDTRCLHNIRFSRLMRLHEH